MRVSRIISRVSVVGTIWMPPVTAAMDYNLTQYDVDNIRAYGDGMIDRDAVEHWLSLNSGDFQAITDFSVTIGDGDFDSGFATEDGEIAYQDAMFPAEDDN